jgi:hypothetical protein
MIETDAIRWTNNVALASNDGADTEYRGVHDGEVLYVVHGTRDERDRRVFKASRRTSAGERHRLHPAGRGGGHKTLRAAKEACENELDSMTDDERATLIGNLRERRELCVTLRHMNADREAHRMSLPELRDAVAALRPAPAEHLAADSTMAQQVRGRMLRLDELRPLPPLVNEYDDGVTVWRVGDRVRSLAPRDPGDVWRIESIAVPTTRPAYAGLLLVERPGGLPIGQTRTALRLTQLKRAGATGDDAELWQRRAIAAEDERGQWVARAGRFERERDELAEQVAKLSRPLGAPYSHADVLKGVLLVLDGWISDCMSNDAAREIADAPDIEHVVLHRADVRAIVESTARDLGIAL